MHGIIGFLVGMGVVLILLGIRKNKIHSHWLVHRNQIRGHADKKERTLSGVFAKLQQDAQSAGLNIPTKHLTLVMFCGVLLGAAVGHAITGSLFFTVAIAVVGMIAPKVWVAWRIAGRRKMFEEQLEEALMELSNGVRAGLTIHQALEQVAPRSPEPMHSVLNETIKFNKSGDPIAEAFEKSGRLIKSRYLELVSASIGLSQSTGANLAEIFDQIAENIRDKKTFESQAKSKLAEGKFAAIVLGLIPLIVIAILRVSNPGYMAPLFQTFKGLLVLGICLTFIGIGVVWINRQLDIKL